MEEHKWSIEKSQKWYEDHDWMTGANFNPSTAINQLETWQEATFDPETIDRELGFAAGIGFNTMRTYLHSLAYKADPEGFKKRMNTYLDIAEKRVPQDGRITLRIAGRAVDVRVSTMPSSHGERVVLRLLDKNTAHLNLADLGMTPDIGAHFSELIRKPHGIILVTGPTGSGKSTTLYAGLTEINSKDRNILTVEDPIEFDLEGIGQTQVNTRVDMTFARGLRAILRQDPDVVMVGEIRDLETAQIAVQASLTGHLVLSTLHTNTASGAITRLEDMGIEPFLLSSSLLAVISQRLVRTLCIECRQQHIPSEGECEILGIKAKKASDYPIYSPTGCAACNQTGYRGRTGIHEMLIVDEKIRDMIHNGHGEQAIEKHIRKSAPSIRDDGCSKVLKGLTSLEEVLRVTRED